MRRVDAGLPIVNHLAVDRDVHLLKGVRHNLAGTDLLCNEQRQFVSLIFEL